MGQGAGWDIAGRAWRFRVIGKRRVVAERSDPNRIIHTANSRPADRGNPDALRRLFHRAGIEAGDFGVMAPRLALGKKKMTTAGKCDQRDENDKANE